MYSLRLSLKLSLLALFVCVLGSFGSGWAQQPPSSFEKQRGQMMLTQIQEDLKKNYYDPAFHGMDVDARFKLAEEKIKQAQSLGQIFGIIAQVLVDLDDSHTFFLPPGFSSKTEYGWQMQMFGDKCYVIAVKPGSDAAAKGLTEGDEIYLLDGRGLARENFWKIQYLYHALRPQPGMHVEIIKPNGQHQELNILAKVQQGVRVKDVTGSGIFDLIRESETENRLHRHRSVEFGDDLFVWKMPQFDLESGKVDDFVGNFRKKKAVIIDLRGNQGGYEDTLLRLIGNLMDHDVKLGDLKGRKDHKPMIAKSVGHDAYKGKVIVLIDSESGSAAELFARVMQLEKRGIVIGDTSAGAVMRAREYQHELGVDTVVFYGVSITDADIIMSDGKSLEHAGVVPDETRLPTAADLAAKRDPVMSYAASLAGVTVAPEKAGAWFPVEWRKN
ncbi:MAG TPA: S41 family peptidase [Pyrinomonadaceae bacterium]|nr:S41 family peptidase [Pyrinomonadaceae bacterium]